MSSPGNTSIFGSSIIYGNVDYGPTYGNVWRPLNQRRFVVDPGNDIIQPYDQLVIYMKTIPETFGVTLPDSVAWMQKPYGGMDLICKDASGNSASFPITFTAFNGSQTINGGTGGSVILNVNGGSIIFSPLPDGTGWITL